MRVYVVTDPERGWDCVVDVFYTYEFSAEEIEAHYRQFYGDQCVVTEKQIATKLED